MADITRIHAREMFENMIWMHRLLYEVDANVAEMRNGDREDLLKAVVQKMELAFASFAFDSRGITNSSEFKAAKYTRLMNSYRIQTSLNKPEGSLSLSDLSRSSAFDVMEDYINGELGHAAPGETPKD